MSVRRLLLGLSATLASTCAPSPVAPSPASSPPAQALSCQLVTRGGSSRQLSQAALQALASAAKETHTDALMVVEDGKVVLEFGDADRRFELMSITKSIASLVVGQVIDRGLVRLDQPMTDFIPAWKGTPKEPIQLRHVLEHTSGLDDKPSTKDIYASGDFVEFAVKAEVKNPPGKSFFYSNRASNLLAPVVKLASGMAIDDFARKNLFAPSDIHDFKWSHDEAGNVQVMAGLQMHALDVARLGQLILDGGRACDTPIVSTDWLRASTGTYQRAGYTPHGLFWWIKPEHSLFGFTAELFQSWGESGVPEEFIDKLRPLEGKYFDKKSFFRAVDNALTGQDRVPGDAELEPFYQMTWKAGRQDCDVKYGPIRAIVADGYGGQYLIIYPGQHVVVVRLRDVKGPDDARQKKSFFDIANEALWGVKGG